MGCHNQLYCNSRSVGIMHDGWYMYPGGATQNISMLCSILYTVLCYAVSPHAFDRYLVPYFSIHFLELSCMSALFLRFVLPPRLWQLFIHTKTLPSPIVSLIPHCLVRYLSVVISSPHFQSWPLHCLNCIYVLQYYFFHTAFPHFLILMTSFLASLTERDI